MRLLKPLETLVLSVLCLLAGGCWSASGPEVVVYTALDEEFSKPILDDFTAATGVAVQPKFDTESTKTVGLANAIIAERNRPRCDVFWNNEILNTLRLKRRGLLEAYYPPIAESYPAMVRSDPSGPCGRGRRSQGGGCISGVRCFEVRNGAGDCGGWWMEYMVNIGRGSWGDRRRMKARRPG